MDIPRIQPHQRDSESLQSSKRKLLACVNGFDNAELDGFMLLCKSRSPSPIIPSMCIRYDFDKEVKPSSIPPSCFTQATPLVTYMEESRREHNLHLNSKPKTYGFNGGLKNIANFDNPLSPESHKRELCSYLQLMKPAERSFARISERPRKLRARTLDHANNTHEEEITNKFMPLPPKETYTNCVDFSEAIRPLLVGLDDEKYTKNGEKPRPRNKLNKKKSKKFNFQLISKFNLRSRRRLKHKTLDTLILRQSHSRKKARRKFLQELKNRKVVEKEREAPPRTPPTMVSPRCDVVATQTRTESDNIDLKNFVDDMLELDKMSEEHRKSVIQSRILTSDSITSLIGKRKNQGENVQRALKIFSNLSNGRKTPEHKCEIEEMGGNVSNAVRNLVIIEHDYASMSSKHEEETDENENEQDEMDVEDSELEGATDDDIEELEGQSRESLSPVPIPTMEVLPINPLIKIKSLHRSLALNARRKRFSNYGLHNWGSKSDNNNLKHSISVNKMSGKILRAFYLDYNLVIVQQASVSFWTQSALGEVLGAQNMWIPKGSAQRIALNETYSQKEAREMVISTETSLAYVELWTKEHKSEVREVPVADVFATVYFWRLRQSGVEKKALQLENIKGGVDDVKYCVLKYYSKVIVSWYSGSGNEKKTKIHSYHLAADFQTVANISEIQPVEHYVASLHNIEDCDNLVMGCGENKITLWNIEYGYIVATIELASIKNPLSTHWVKCDRGFLFTIQECADQELRLIAINGMNHSWKKLQNYVPSPGFKGLKGVYVENGILLAYYSEGILCWNAQTGELIMEETPNNCVYIPSGKHVIMLANEKIVVKYSLSHLITSEDI